MTGGALTTCYCHTRTGLEDVTTQCVLQDSCTQNEWYHQECIPKTDRLPDKWFCRTECEEKRSKEMTERDGILEYSKALLHQVLRDCIRTGDGSGMM